MPVSTLISSSPEETGTIGRDLAGRLRRGDCVALFGELGSGKTCLVQGICNGLQVTGPVTSPTFILVHEYRGRVKGGVLPVYHFDLYRLGGPEELIDLGWDDYLDSGGICLVEWADRADGLLPPHTITVKIDAPQRRLRTFKLTYGE